MPTHQPTASLPLIDLAKSVAITAGITRKEKTTSTPAIATEDVMTNAKVT